MGCFLMDSFLDGPALLFPDGLSLDGLASSFSDRSSPDELYSDGLASSFPEESPS